MGSIIKTDDKFCWVTLVTRPSYLPGVIILAHTLDRVGSNFPLVVQYTASLGDEAIQALKSEATARGRIVPDRVEILFPRNGQENVAIVAARFEDTWTKLRAFEVYKSGFTKACFLDADMAIFRNPDAIFDIPLPGQDWLGANHACVCNLDQDPWAPENWRKGNCAYTMLTDPDQCVEQMVNGCRPTYRMLNGGMFLFYPSETLWSRMMTSFNTSIKLQTYQFPDQDFLADFFWNKWQPMSWKYNALKTMRYWHPVLWSDENVVVLHYIVDKPWERKVSPDGIAGHMGRDGETHQWWWNMYESWLKSQKQLDDVALKSICKLIDTQTPFDKRVELPQEPGTPADVAPYVAP